MAQARNNHRVDRIPSAGSVTGADQHEYATQTLFDQVKERKVLTIVIFLSQICQKIQLFFSIQLPFLSNIVIIGRLRDTWEKQPELGGLK